MARRLQIRKGTADEHTNFTGANGELTYDETNKRIRFHDGVTVGGIPLAKVSDSGLPLGVPIWHNGTENQIPVAHIPYNGQLLSRTTYPAMWAKVQSTFQKITDAEWLADPKKRGCYSLGDGSTTFRMPDLNGVQTNSIKAVVLRGDGGGIVAGEAKTIGQMDTDAIRNITGSVNAIRMGIGWTPTSTGALIGKSSTASGDANAGSSATMTIDIDASKVVPTAPENRMNSVYGIWICRVGDTATEIAEPTKHAVLTGGNTFNGSQKVVGNLEVSGTNNIPYLGNKQTRKIITIVSGVEYTNTTQKPIVVGVTFRSTASSIQQMATSLTVGSIVVVEFTDYVATNSYKQTISQVILPNEKYTFRAVAHSVIESAWEIS